MAEIDLLLDLQARLTRLETTLHRLVEQRTAKEWYTTADIAGILAKAEFTVREWCRLGRLRAEKRHSGRGPHAAWVVAHVELQRYQREGLLPLEGGGFFARYEAVVLKKGQSYR